MRLAIVATHPIQYYSPWYRHISQQRAADIKVFYLWDFGVTPQVDAGFGQTVEWDIPLLDGYEHEFVPNVAARKGTSHFRGLDNPDLEHRVRKFDPDSVLLTCYNYISTMRFLLRWRSSHVPLLFRGDSHRIVPPRGLSAPLRRLFIARVFAQFECLLYVGRANREYYAYHGVPEEKLFFAPHCVDNDRFSAAREQAGPDAIEWRRKLGIPDDHAVVMFVGKLQQKKRPQDLLRAFRKLSPANTSLVFVGSGELEEELKKEARDSSWIFFVPFQNQSQIPRTLCAADLVVLPSMGPSETWGLVLNEAMCMGRAVIASHHVGAADDLIADGRSGLIFEAGNVESLAGALREALSDRSRLKRWGDEGRRRVERYCYTTATEGLVKALARAKERLR